MTCVIDIDQLKHWFKQCHASTQLAASYKEYRQLREQEINLAEDEDINLAEDEDGEDITLTTEDFKAVKSTRMPQTLIRIVLSIFQ